MPLYCRVNPKGEGITNIRTCEARAEHTSSISQMLSLACFPWCKNWCNLQPFMFFIKPNVKIEHLLTPHCKVWIKYYVLEGALHIYYEISRRFSVFDVLLQNCKFLWVSVSGIKRSECHLCLANTECSLKHHVFNMLFLYVRPARGDLLLFIVGGISIHGCWQLWVKDPWFKINERKPTEVSAF